MFENLKMICFLQVAIKIIDKTQLNPSSLQKVSHSTLTYYYWKGCFVGWVQFHSINSNYCSNSLQFILLIQIISIIFFSLISCWVIIDQQRYCPTFLGP